MSLQDEIIDINGNKITDESKCIEHHPDGDTYVSSSPITQPKSYPGLLYYTCLSEDRLKLKRKYTQYTYKMKKQ